MASNIFYRNMAYFKSILKFGSVWAMKMVGVDGAQNDMISEALSQRMDRAGFRM
jgi:hypothetical protein